MTDLDRAREWLAKRDITSEADVLDLAAEFEKVRRSQLIRDASERAGRVREYHE